MNRRTFLYQIGNLIGTGLVITTLPSCDKYQFSETYRTGSISGSFVTGSMTGTGYIYTGSISSPFTSSTQ